MDFDKSKSFSEYINHHTLLYGETNTKKTYYTAMFVKFLVDSNFNPLDIHLFMPVGCWICFLFNLVFCKTIQL